MEIVRETRQKLKLTQVELGKYLGVAGNTVARWERGVSSPEYPEMLELALLGLETKLQNVKTREKIRKIEAKARKYAAISEAILQRMNA